MDRVNGMKEKGTGEAECSFLPGEEGSGRGSSGARKQVGGQQVSSREE